MNQQNNAKAAIDSFQLQSLIDSHDNPFVVIDRNYRIVATNAAYRKTYCKDNEDVTGLLCYQVSHHNKVPCCELGEDCPHDFLFAKGKAVSCVHIHYDSNHGMRQVRVRAYPLRTADGELYMGELVEDIDLPKQPAATVARMVGRTPQFLACLEQLKTAAAARAPVLLQGETGTGKELAARFIHSHSARREQPFMTVDCTTLTDTLFEAEVFGHARGAFTGSVGEKIGLFEQASGGTVFLDEIGDMPMAQQSKLLRVLESGQFRRVGGRNTRKVDVRVVCASNRHLWDAVREGSFREDLYYRIACLTVRMPSLRERINDIEVLAPSLLQTICQSVQKELSLTDDAIERLKNYDYPGNIRELRNVLFVAVTHSVTSIIDGDTIDRVIDQMLRDRPVQRDRAPLQASVSQDDNEAGNERVTSLQDNEARHIVTLLQRFRGSRRQVANSLGISERTLYRKLKKFGIN